MLKSALIVASVYGLLVLLVLGCSGKVSGSNDTNFEARIPTPAGDITVKQTANNKASQETPPNASGVSTLLLGAAGWESAISGIWKPDIGGAGRLLLTGIGAAFVLGGLVLAIKFKSVWLGIGIGVAGACFIVATEVMKQLGWVFLAGVALLIILGAGALAVWLFRRQQAANVMPVVVKKLNEAMHADSAVKASTATREAVTALRPVMPAVDREFEAQKK